MKSRKTDKRKHNDTSLDSSGVRLNKYLAQCGLGSRRKCDEIIKTGRIYINGNPVKELGIQIDPQKDKISYKGKILKSIRALEYWIFHKPKGPLVTRNDPSGRETIYDYIKKEGKNVDHLNYVGRLDRNSEGLLLITNDGALIHALTHPRFHIKKVYRVRINRNLSPGHAEQMVNEGVISQGQVLHAGKIRSISHANENEKWYEIDLYEGKNRQIRRLFEALGYTIIRLKRIQFGSLRLNTLQRGKLRQLTNREKRAMQNTGFQQKPNN